MLVRRHHLVGGGACLGVPGEGGAPGCSHSTQAPANAERVRVASVWRVACGVQGCTIPRMPGLRRRNAGVWEFGGIPEYRHAPCGTPLVACGVWRAAADSCCT